MFRVKKNDRVKVLSGRDKGKEGTVIQLDQKQEKVLVKGVAIVTRHVKARKQGQVSAIKTEEQFVDMAKVMPVCTACKKACRVNFKQLENTKVRMCNRCEETF